MTYHKAAIMVSCPQSHCVASKITLANELSQAQVQQSDSYLLNETRSVVATLVTASTDTMAIHSSQRKATSPTPSSTPVFGQMYVPATLRLHGRYEPPPNPSTLRSTKASPAPRVTSSPPTGNKQSTTSNRKPTTSKSTNSPSHASRK